MDIEEFNTKQNKGGVEVVKAPAFEADKPQTQAPKGIVEQDFASIVLNLRTVRQPLATVPTFIQNLLDQIQFYESGATRRLYIYMNGTWRYVALT